MVSYLNRYFSNNCKISLNYICFLLGAKASSSKLKSSSANSSPKHYLPNHIPVMSAMEKRVQMMKKKAAKKSEKKK